MGFSTSTIKSLEYNRGQRRHRSLFTTSKEKTLDLLNKEEFQKNEIKEGSKISSNKPLPFLVRLWNILK